MKVNNDGCHVTKKINYYSVGVVSLLGVALGDTSPTQWREHVLSGPSTHCSAEAAKKAVEIQKDGGREGGKEGEREHIIMHENSNIPTILIIIIMPANLPQTPFSPKTLYPKQLLRSPSHCPQICAYPLRLAMHYIHTHTYIHTSNKNSIKSYMNIAIKNLTKSSTLQIDNRVAQKRGLYHAVAVACTLGVARRVDRLSQAV